MATASPLVRGLAALLAGTVFGVGLALAQMTDPRKVLNFLDVTGRWDPSLLFVLGGAMLLAAVGFRLVLQRPTPLLEPTFHISKRSRIDTGLVTGSVLFGIGWGLAGYCPGPAVASLGLGNAEALWVVPAMLAGSALRHWQLVRGPSAAVPADQPPA